MLETEIDYKYTAEGPGGASALALDPSVIQMNQADHYNLPLDGLKEMKDKAFLSMKHHQANILSKFTQNGKKNVDAAALDIDSDVNITV